MNDFKAHPNPTSARPQSVDLQQLALHSAKVVVGLTVLAAALGACLAVVLAVWGTSQFDSQEAGWVAWFLVIGAWILAGLLGAAGGGLIGFRLAIRRQTKTLQGTLASAIDVDKLIQEFSRGVRNR